MTPSMPPDGFLDDENGPPDGFDDVTPQSQGVFSPQNISAMARPVLEVGGAVGGGAIGSGLGPMGTAGGGVLGYATGKSAADYLDRKLGIMEPIENVPEALQETAGNLYEGGKFESTNMVAGPIIKGAINNPVTRFAGRQLGNVGSLITGVPAKDYTTLFKNPEGILPGKLNKAGKLFAKAKESAGIPNETSPESLKALKGALPRVQSTYQKIFEGKPVTAAEAQLAKQSLDSIRPLPNGKNGELLHHLDTIRESFQQVIANSSPELQVANKTYAIAKAGDKFKSIFPRNKSGTPSFIRGGALGAVGMAHPALAPFGTPIGQGVITAGAGVATKGVQTVASQPALTAPLVQKALEKRKLDKKTARMFYEQAGGDKEEARRLAAEAGY